MADFDSFGEGFAEFYHLHTAETAEALHRILLLQQPFKSTADSFEPMMLLHGIHKTEPEATFDTALLLVTDRRWRKAAGRLIRNIAESGMLDGDALDEMADLLIAADGHLYKEIPEEWFGGEEIVLDLPQENVKAEPEADLEAEDRSVKPLAVSRQVYSPLRRWAAARLIARDPEVWRELFVATADLGRADGAATMRGLLDGLAHLPAEAQRLLVEVGVDWPDSGVRRQALLLVAEAGDRQTAHDLAAQDPTAAIRKWAPKLLEAAPAARDEPTDASGEPADVVIPPERPGQEALF